jgi:uncharacterized protein (DUF58 family)
MVLAGGIPLALLPVLIGGEFWVFWFSFLCLVLVLMGIDGALSRPARKAEITVNIPEQIFIGRPGHMDIQVNLPDKFIPGTLEILVEWDSLLENGKPRTITPDEKGHAALSFELVARRRGMAHISRVWIRWSGPLGLMSQTLVQLQDREVPVVPDIQGVRNSALRFFGSREHLAGIKLEHYAGDGSEFDRLREFVPGLDNRTIDWKASARHWKLLSREFIAERNHQIIIAIDTGRLMGEPVGGIPKLDHAINAGLLLSWYSLRTGDRVGLVGFDKHINLYREPVRGVGSFPGLHTSTSQLTYSPEETNFTLSFAQLASRLRRRTLIVLLTDFVDTISARLMEENLQRLSRRHLVLFVSVRNPDLQAIVTKRPDTIGAMARSVVASDILQDREIVLSGLRRYGIQTIDAPPEGISPELLNRYLDIKRREQIA